MEDGQRCEDVKGKTTGREKGLGPTGDVRVSLEVEGRLRKGRRTEVDDVDGVNSQSWRKGRRH